MELYISAYIQNELIYKWYILYISSSQSGIGSYSGWYIINYNLNTYTYIYTYTYEEPLYNVKLNSPELKC